MQSPSPENLSFNKWTQADILDLPPQSKNIKPKGEWQGNLCFHHTQQGKDVQGGRTLVRAQKQPLWMSFSSGQQSSVMERALDQESGVAESSFSLQKPWCLPLEKNPILPIPSPGFSVPT